MAREPDDLYRGEAEIIPPSRQGASARGQRGVWIEQGPAGGFRVHLATPGPWGTLGLLAGAGIIVACVFFLFVSAVLVAIPVIGILVGVSLLGAIARRYMQHRA